MENLRFPTPIDAVNLNATLKGEILGDPHLKVERIGSIQNSLEGDLLYYADRKYQEFLSKLKNVIIITSPDLVKESLPVTYILVANPKASFARLIQQFSGSSPEIQGISPMAYLHPSVKVGKNASVGAFAYVGQDVEIGEDVVIYPHAYIGAKVKIGKGSRIHPKVVLGSQTQLGCHVQIFAGTVVGSDGFGIFQEQASLALVEMPQVGTVIIEDYVRIGANSTVDRGTLGETKIGAHTKIDDQVHIGHNVQIGKNTIICGKTGIAGSVKIGDHVIIGGGVGISHGVHIDSHVKIGAMAGVGQDLKEGKSYFLCPAMEVQTALKVVRAWRRLPEIWKRLQALEKTKIYK